MKFNFIKNRLLPLICAIFFALGTIYVCFNQSSHTVLADTSGNYYFYNGSPYSSVFTRKLNYNLTTGVEEIYLGGSNFSLENNFVFELSTFRYYLFSNTYYSSNTINGVTFYSYIPFLLGYDLKIGQGQTISEAQYQVRSRSTFIDFSNQTNSNSNFYNVPSLLYANSDSFDTSVYGNYGGTVISPLSTSQFQLIYGYGYSHLPLKNDSTGWYIDLEYDKYHYFIMFDVGSFNSLSSNGICYRAFEIYCSQRMTTISSVSVRNSTFPFTIFTNGNMFQGKDPNSILYDSLRFNYLGTATGNDALYMNVYCYTKPNEQWNTNNIYDYTRDWYNMAEISSLDGYQLGYDKGLEEGIERGQVGMQQAVEESYNSGRQNGYSEGYQAGEDVGYDLGYSEGRVDASDYSFLSLLGAVVDAPIIAIVGDKDSKGLLSFNLLGFDLSTVFYSIVTISIIIFIIRMSFK